MDDLPGFNLGYGFDPSTGQTIVAMNNPLESKMPVSLVMQNRVGKGTVLISSNFLPNRYFLTGYDMMSGMDPKLGFSQLTAKYQAEMKRVPGTTYFNRKSVTD